MKPGKDKMKEIRGDILDAIKLFGLETVETELKIVVMGVRSRVFDKNVVVEIGVDTEKGT